MGTAHALHYRRNACQRHFVSVYCGNVYLNSLVGVIVMMGLILVVMNIYRNPAVALMPDITPNPPLQSQRYH